MKLENEKAFYFKNSNKDSILTDKDEEQYRNINICRFCEKEIFSDQVKDQCNFTRKYRRPANSKCCKTVTQKQSNFISFIFHNFTNFDCHLLFKNYLQKKNERVNLDVLPKSNGKNICVIYGNIRFVDSYRFSSSSLDSLVKTLIDNNHKAFKL